MSNDRAPVWLPETPADPSAVRRSATPSSTRVAGRYALRAPLGRGGYASVWEAHDQVTDGLVALKRFHHEDGVRAVRIRREVAALRMLRMPGVVRLFDEGVDEDGTYIVMERVDGAPFPGTGVTVSWEVLRPTVIALLGTLARIHAMGIVHRDLKPANVLVREDGTPVVLDFGIARWEIGGRVTGTGEVLGTPTYLAPEQILSEPVSPATDLYALGVMIFEALSGSLPFDGAIQRGAMFARLFVTAPALAERAPAVPPEVAELVARLLARAPTDRPQSAEDVLHRLASSRSAEGASSRWLGSRAPIEHLVDAASHGVSADVTGPVGSGRTRCLQECASALRSRGREVRWLGPSREPFGSAEKLLGAIEGVTLDDARADVQRRLEALLRGGVVVIADDLDRVDPLSRAALEAVRGEGAVLRALDAQHPDAVVAEHLGPLDPAALATLFDAPERLFHLRSDAVDALLDATGGIASAVFGTLEMWLVSGVVRRLDDRLRIDRVGIERARSLRRHAGLRDATRSLAPPPREELLALHHAISVAWPHATVEVLGAVLGVAPWRLRALLDELTALGAARPSAAGSYEALPTPWVDLARSPESRRALHARIADAMPAGTRGRLDHLLHGFDESRAGAEELLREAVCTARSLGAEGRLDPAQLALADTLAVVQRLPASDLPDLRELFVCWTEVAFADGAPHAMDRLLYEIVRVDASGALEDLAALIRAGLARLGAGTHTSALVDALRPSEDPRIERRRFALRVASARRASTQAEGDVIAEAWTSVRATRDPEFEAELRGWEGRVYYRQGRYADAARAHEDAASRATWRSRRIENAVAAASAWMEDHALDRAIELADQARELAARARHPIHEARAEWVRRSARMRRGEALAVDHELLDATRTLDVPEVTMLVTMCESAIAWRAGDHGAARALADTSRGIWSARGLTECADLMALLSLCAGRAPEPGEVDAIAARLPVCRMPRIGLQIRNLLWMTARIPLEPTRAMVDALASVRTLHPGIRLEVLAVSEIAEGHEAISSRLRADSRTLG